MSAYVRKTRCAAARCPHCTWFQAFFGVDVKELRLRAVVEQALHIAAAHAANSRRRAS